MKPRKMSIIIPSYNEEKNILPLHKEIKEVLSKLVASSELSGFEVIFVNDGSTDKTQEILEQLKKSEKEKIKIVKFRKNFGQTAALNAGFELASGDLIVTMDP